MILLKVIGEMLKTLLQIWKDKSGGIGSIFSAISGLASIASSVGGLFGRKGSSSSAPAPVPAPVPAPAAAPDKTGQVRQATDKARRRRAASAGRSGTILTSPLGLTGDDNVARPSLLGQ